MIKILCVPIQQSKNGMSMIYYIDKIVRSYVEIVEMDVSFAFLGLACRKLFWKRKNVTCIS